MTLNAEAIRKMADYNSGIAELNLVRTKPVLALSSASGVSGIAATDMSLSFDEGNPAYFRDSVGHYRITASPSLSAVDNFNARTGFGAVFFPGALPASIHTNTTGGSLMIKAQSNKALFTSNNRFYDFSIEFWLNPLKLENGEHIVLWT